ncbi:MAG: tRNA 2-thiouridine(34) synthase MnmA, partial [Oscillospiraceae bacterium]|nr:tRNA 2-thiouridine(34) synthase MnmA [Oscillospiraceae bacterium]
VSAVVFKMSSLHDTAVEDAKRVADFLSIPLYVKDITAVFEQNVILPFCDYYRSGKTPNPCIFCNPTTKFKALIDTANELGIEKIATGHYAKTENIDGKTYLKKAGFIPRDQSYMLYRLPQDILSRLVLPLNELDKPSVREIASKIGLFCANKPDSQEICFVENNDYASFIEGRFGKSPEGDFIAPNGKVCGKHKGILHYTVGQRKHLGIALGTPVFIKEIDATNNKIYLANSGEEYANAVTLTDCVYIPDKTAVLGKNLTAKIRSMAKPVPISLEVLDETNAVVRFENAERAPAPGQSCVIYDGDFCLGGGYIDKQINK